MANAGLALSFTGLYQFNVVVPNGGYYCSAVVLHAWRSEGWSDAVHCDWELEFFRVCPHADAWRFSVCDTDGEDVDTLENT